MTRIKFDPKLMHLKTRFLPHRDTGAARGRMGDPGRRAASFHPERI